MVLPVGGRLAAVVFVVILLAASSAGCFARGDDSEPDKVLKTWSRSAPTEANRNVGFDVPAGTDELKIVVSTKPPKSSGGDSNFPGCGQWCDEWAAMDDDEENVNGVVSFTIWAPGNILKDTAPHGYDEDESFTYFQPAAGKWSVQVTYQTYEGPAAVRAVEPVAASTALFGDSTLDIIGVILAIGTLFGGYWLYRRRGQFLSRELHRMDNTVKHFSDNVDECRANLLAMRGDLKELLVKRKIQESQYIILDKRLEQYLADLETPGNKHAPDGKPPPADPPGSALQRIRRTQG